MERVALAKPTLNEVLAIEEIIDQVSVDVLLNTRLVATACVMYGYSTDNTINIPLKSRDNCTMAMARGRWGANSACFKTCINKESSSSGT